MVTPDDSTGRAQAHFPHLLRQGLIVARRYVEADGEAAPIGAADRERALNLLRYVFRTEQEWPAAQALLLAMAPKMERAGHREDWLPYLVAGADLADAQGEPFATATLYLHIGIIHRLQNNYAAAKHYLHHSATLFHEQGKPREQARALNQLGYVAFSQEVPEQAAALAQAAAALLAENDVEQAMSLSLLGLVARIRREWQAAEEYHRRALQLREAAAQPREIAWSLQNLANALRGQGDNAAAIDLFERAIVLLEQVKDPVNRATAQMNLGIIYSLQQDPIRAFALYAAAEQVFRQTGNKQNLAKIKVNQGLEYLAVESWERAAEAFQLSAEIFQHLDNKGAQLNALDGLGMSYLAQGCYAEALTIFTGIADELTQIEGTYFFDPLSKRLPEQIARSKAGLASFASQSGEG